MKKRIILIAVILVIVSAGGYAAYFWHQINNPKDLFNIPVNNGSHKSVDSDQAPEPTIVPWQFTESKLNLLLLGLDASEERYESMRVFRSDTIMLACIDFTENKVDLISVPRDSYVKIPGRKERGRVNAAFVYGGGFKGEGFSTTIQTVSDILGGIPIHYYAAIDMNIFIKIIDCLDGINYEVDVPVSKAGLKPGLQKLDGKQTLAYARHRKTAGGDIDRVDRQQRLMIGILDQLKSSDSLTKLPGIYDSIKDDVWTNLNIRQIAALALFASKMDMADLHRHMVPGNFLDMDRISYWGIDQKKKNKMINELFGLNITTYDKEDDVHYIKGQLRKRLAELTTLAQQMIGEGSQVLTDYGHVLLAQEFSSINSRVQRLYEALEDGQLEDIEIVAIDMENELAALTPQLAERDQAMSSGWRSLSAIQEELPYYEDKISAAEQEQLKSKMNALQQKMGQKEFSAISGLAVELDDYWDGLKNKLDVEPTPAPTSTPTPDLTPSPEPTPIPTSEPTPTPIESPTPAS